MNRKERIIESVNRTSLSDAYKNNIVTYLTTTRNITKDKAIQFVDKVIETSVKLPNVDIIETVIDGKLEQKTIPFSILSSKINNSVMAPSGSLYHPVNKKRSFVSALVKNGLKLRSDVKKKMFKAISDGDTESAAKYESEQKTIKVKLNALPGGFGSPSNLFYDKGSYNSVTSTARMLISNSFVCCEQFLSGNIPLFNIEEVYNLITTIINYGPNDNLINSTIDKYNIKRVNTEELIEYLNNQIQLYNRGLDLKSTEIYNYLKKLSSAKINFIYYHSNLKHLIMDNKNIFLPKIKDIFNYDKNCKIDSDITPDMFYKCNSDIMAIVTTLISEELKDIKIKDIVDEHHDKAKLCVQIYRGVENKLSFFNELFDTFIFHDINFQLVLHRSSMQRKSVVVSDTDSVIYTAKEWAEMYTGTNEKITHDSYNVAALINYWLTEANADVMSKYIIGIGAIKEDIAYIKMKNEFLYPSLILFDTKKVYAGIIKVQEGVFLNQMKPDIKGASIRGISASSEAKEFTKHILIDKILQPVIDSNISALDIIGEVIDFELKIKQSLKLGELQYLPIISFGSADDYDDEDRTSYFYTKAWNFIFGEKYGEIRPPDKLPLLKINKPTELYFSQLKQKDEKIYNKFKEFLENNKVPTAFFIETNQNKIPEELLPLIDYRHLIYYNVNPVYLVLESLNMSIGFSKQKLLLSDIYCCE
jgi:hypothetical protein